MPNYDLITLQKKLLQRRRIEPSGCWEWTGYTKKGGFQYGWINVGSRSDGSSRGMHVHRVAAAIWLGLDLNQPLIHVCHKCDNPPCFNPDHLFLGSNRDNAVDRHSKGRTNPARGEKVNTAKLSADKVRQMREMKSTYPQMTDKEIGCLFGVTQAMASRVIRFRAWKHVKCTSP